MINEQTREGYKMVLLRAGIMMMFHSVMCKYNAPLTILLNNTLNGILQFLNGTWWAQNFILYGSQLDWKILYKNSF